MADTVTERRESIAGVPTLELDDAMGEVVIIDQTLLPGEVVLEHLRTREEARRAIQRLEVRGAPALGVFAAMALYLDARHWLEAHPTAASEDVWERLLETRAYLDSSRPTAVNLSWATRRMLAAVATDPACSACAPLDPELMVDGLAREARAIRDEDVASCRAIGEHGLSLVEDGFGVLTHCNAGRLCAVEYGTATAPIYLAKERGMALRAYCDETRPLLQGARLTALELMAAGVDTTLLCDNMSNSLMATGAIDAIFVGADRIAANGDTANKIGTSMLALAAAEHGVPFYVCAPTSTIDAACASGAAIPIEMRDGAEVTELHYAHRMAPEGVKVYNPAFDVTPARLIAAIVTERGVLRPPFEGSIAAALGDARR